MQRVISGYYGNGLFHIAEILTDSSHFVADSET